jgi:transposase
MESQQAEKKVTVGRSSYRFTIAEKKEAVSLVEAGFSCKEVRAQYQISDVTLNNWRERFSLSDPPVKLKTYTPSQKRSVIRAVEGGMSVRQAAIAFGIVSLTSIRKWIRESNAENAELGTIEMKNPPQNQLKDQDLNALKQQLAEAQLKIKALETMIDVAEEHLKIDIRKKSGARQSPK